MLNLAELLIFLTSVVSHYERTAPTVSTWAVTLYQALQEDTRQVTVAEVLCAQTLFEEGQWEQPNLAANRVYKLLSALGKDTTGQAGY